MHESIPARRIKHLRRNVAHASSRYYLSFVTSLVKQKCLHQLVLFDTGRQIRLRHIRNGVEQPPLFEDNNYDFNYQSMRIKTNPVKVYPVRCDILCADNV